MYELTNGKKYQNNQRQIRYRCNGQMRQEKTIHVYIKRVFGGSKRRDSMARGTLEQSRRLDAAM